MPSVETRGPLLLSMIDKAAALNIEMETHLDAISYNVNKIFDCGDVHFKEKASTDAIVDKTQNDFVTDMNDKILKLDSLCKKAAQINDNLLKLI